MRSFITCDALGYLEPRAWMSVFHYPQHNYPAILNFYGCTLRKETYSCVFRFAMLGFIPSPGNVRILRSLILPCTCSRCSHHSQIVRVYSYTLGRKHTAHNLACARSYTFLHSSHPPDSHASDLVTHQSATSSKEKREEPENKRRGVCHERSKRWDLTVGIEVHAELATTTKLFSTASTDLTSASNVNTSVFDTASPGAQPRLQREALLPALRAALTLNCEIQAQSGWDRKHYFWWDQPQGYQITQYYSPFAKNGRLTLHPWDDFDPEDTVNGRGELNIGIKQIQMEQDTAKTLLQPPDTYLLDFNRAGLPLVEIITRPEIKSPKTAAAVVRKIQGMLQSVGANSVGMEMGGLRADVNVSVRKKDAIAQVEGLTYGGVTGLGQRTEIKNLSSFKAVEDAIVAERDRQIDVLESGAKVEGETRRWTLGATTTHRLRGKEGEVDYRYMPDPDLAPLHIGDSLVQYLSTTMPRTQDEWVKELINTTSNEPHRLSVEDAKVLANLDDGERLEFYLDTLKILEEELGQDKRIGYNQEVSLGQLVCNWYVETKSFLFI